MLVSGPVLVSQLRSLVSRHGVAPSKSLGSEAWWTLCLVFTLAGCTKPETNPGADSQAQSTDDETTAATERACEDWISGSEARRIVSEGGLLLDVRTPEEYAEGHLDGAQNIPVQELSSRMSEIPEDQHVVVYCKSGRRADQAARMLSAQGRRVSEIGHMGQYHPDAPAGCVE